jgi:hypothetical protein
VDPPFGTEPVGDAVLETNDASDAINEIVRVLGISHGS